MMKPKLVNRIRLAAAALATALTMSGPAHAATMQEAAQDYHAGKYGQSLHKFEELSRTSRGAEAVLDHYYMALCLQSMGQYERAKTEYAWVGTYGDAKMKAMAQAGQAQLSRGQPYQSTQFTQSAQSPQSIGRGSAAGGQIRRILEFTADY